MLLPSNYVLVIHSTNEGTFTHFRWQDIMDEHDGCSLQLSPSLCDNGRSVLAGNMVMHEPHWAK